MRVIIGTLNGVVKVHELEKATVQLWGNQDPKLEIDVMQFTSHFGEEDVIIGRANGTVEIFDVHNGEKKLELSNYEGRFCGIHLFQKTENKKAHLLTCSTDGDVILRNISENSEDREKLPSPFMKLGKGINRLRVHNEEELFVVGGNEKAIQIFDINQQKAIFTAKNVTNSNLNLQAKVWNKDVQFLVGSKTNVASVTHYKQLRIYDTTAQRRPVVNVDVGKYPLNALSCSSDGKYLLLSDTSGGVFQYCLRQNAVIGAYKGKIVGSIRTIDCHPTLPQFVCGGLDRFVRVFDIESRKCLHSIYTKQKINCCLFSKELEIIKEEEKNEDSVDSLLDKLNVVQDANDDEDDLGFENAEEDDQEEDGEGDDDDDDDSEEEIKVQKKPSNGNKGKASLAKKIPQKIQKNNKKAPSKRPLPQKSQRGNNKKQKFK